MILIARVSEAAFDIHADNSVEEHDELVASVLATATALSPTAVVSEVAACVKGALSDLCDGELGDGEEEARYIAELAAAVIDEARHGERRVLKVGEGMPMGQLWMVNLSVAPS